MAAASTSRRIGAQDSKTRAQLLDAAERLMLEEGYAAVTSRRVAAKADLKPQLVHYYFRTMDDLFLEIFRRRAEKELPRFERAIAKDGSLRNLWRLNADPRGAAFSIEFAALANHRKAIRAEIARYAERFRVAQVEALRAALAAHGISDDQVPPIVAVLTMTGLAQVLALEGALGVTAGHDVMLEFVERTIAQLETRTESPPAGGPPRSRANEHLVASWPVEPWPVEPWPVESRLVASWLIEFWPRGLRPRFRPEASGQSARPRVSPARAPGAAAGAGRCR